MVNRVEGCKEIEENKDRRGRLPAQSAGIL